MIRQVLEAINERGRESIDTFTSQMELAGWTRTDTYSDSAAFQQWVDPTGIATANVSINLSQTAITGIDLFVDHSKAPPKQKDTELFSTVKSETSLETRRASIEGDFANSRTLLSTYRRFMKQQGIK